MNSSSKTDFGSTDLAVQTIVEKVLADLDLIESQCYLGDRWHQNSYHGCLPDWGTDQGKSSLGAFLEPT
jgi:hypothetical protein